MATDAAGAVVWAVRYLPFGGIDEVTADTGVLTQNLRFPGQWFQAETGLHQNWMRDYDPTTGRYLQADPLGLVDGASVYGYARQSPVRFVDPSGEYALAGCAGGPIACTVTVVATVAAGIYAILTAPDAPDVPNPSDIAGDDGNCPDPCEQAKQRVRDAKEQHVAINGSARCLPGDGTPILYSKFRKWQEECQARRQVRKVCPTDTDPTDDQHFSPITQACLYATECARLLSGRP